MSKVVCFKFIQFEKVYVCAGVDGSLEGACGGEIACINGSLLKRNPYTLTIGFVYLLTFDT
jgi:hypothetical protein